MEAAGCGEAEVGGDGLGEDGEVVVRPVLADDVLPAKEVVIGEGGCLAPLGLDFPAMEVGWEGDAVGDGELGVVVACLEGGLGLVEVVVVASASRVESGQVMDATCLDRFCGHGSADGLFVEAFGEDEVDDGLFSAVGPLAVAFLETVGEGDDGFAPPGLALSPCVRGDGFPGEAIEEGGIDEMVEGTDAVAGARGFPEEADGEDEQVAEDCHGDDDGHQEEASGSFFKGAEHWWRWTWDEGRLTWRDATHVLRALMFSSGDDGGESLGGPLFFQQSLCGSGGSDGGWGGSGLGVSVAWPF